MVIVLDGGDRNPREKRDRREFRIFVLLLSPASINVMVIVRVLDMHFIGIETDNGT